MANAHELHTVIDGSKLPEELRDFHALGLDERNRLVGLDQEGTIHSIRNISRVALAGFHEAGGIGPRSLESQIQALSDMVNSFQAELETERLQRVEEREDLLRQIENLQGRLDANDPLKRNFNLDDQVQIRNAEGELETGWTVASGVWRQEEDGEAVDYVTVVKDAAFTQEKLEDLRQWQTEAAPTDPIEADPATQPDEDDQPQQSLFRRLRNRPTIITGNLLTGRNGEVHETNRRGRLLGGAALVGVGIFAWEVFEHKFLGHSPSREARNHLQDQLSQLQVREANDHATDVKLAAAEIKLQAALVNEVTANHAAEMARIASDHKAEMNALAHLSPSHSGVADHMHNGWGYAHSRGGHAINQVKMTGASLRYRGDTIWHEVAGRLRSRFGHNADNNQIAKATARVLKLNGLRWNAGGTGIDAHKLPVGFQFKIPANIAHMFKK